MELVLSAPAGPLMTTTSGAVCCAACGLPLVEVADLWAAVARPLCAACARWAALLTRDDKDFLRTNKIKAGPSSEVAA